MDDLQNDPRNCDVMFDLIMRDPEWSNVFKPIHVNQFRDPSGPNLPQDFDLSSHPVNYFQLFFTDTVISTICENTNKYKKFRCEQKKIVNPQYEEKHWEDVDVPCMKAYIGLSIMFGVLKQARYRTYWSTDEFLGNSAVKSVFTLRRYQKISEYLHISDHSDEIPQGHRDYDKLGKIRWLINDLMPKLPQFYRPHCEQTIDEGFVKFAGRCKFIHFSPAKPIRRGIKIWKRCDSTSAYCQEFEIYLGKGQTQPSKFSPIFDTVWSLCKNIAGKNHRIYVDNFFSLVQLAKFLYSKGICLNSTVCQNKKLLPDSFRRKSTPRSHNRIERGHHVTFQSSRLSNLCCTQWIDTKPVLFLSTLSQPKSQTTVMCHVGHRYIGVSTPSAAKNYSKFMNGIDKHDKILSCFKYGALGHGSNKVWKRLFWHLVNICAANAWILFAETSQKEKSKYYDNMAFRCELAKGLIGGYTSRKRIVNTDRYGSSYSIENLSSHHFVRMKAQKPKRCVHHSKFQPNKKKRFDSLYGCFQCNSHMCRDCFHISHTT